LLDERMAAGGLIVDLLSHREMQMALDVHGHIGRLDARLNQYRRYSADYLRVVHPAEEARWHVPPQSVEDSHQRPCMLCFRQLLGLPFELPLPAATGRRSA
jgi:hypothetical protein